VKRGMTAAPGDFSPRAAPVVARLKVPSGTAPAYAWTVAASLAAASSASSSSAVGSGPNSTSLYR
jgi:hypothetical protein